MPDTRGKENWSRGIQFVDLERKDYKSLGILLSDDTKDRKMWWIDFILITVEYQETG